MSKRRIILINPKFQLRFALYVCSWLFALSLIYPLIIYSLFDYVFKHLAINPEGPALSTMIETRQELLWLMILMQSVFLGVTFLISIFMSHRIAGPLFKLNQYFQEAAQGTLRGGIRFRRGDHFRELADGYNRLVDGIGAVLDKNGASAAKAIVHLESAIKAADEESKKEIGEALFLLREIRDHGGNPPAVG